MTFQHFLKKLIKYFWVFILVSATIFLVWNNVITKPEFLGNISVGANFSNIEINDNNMNSEKDYSTLSTNLSKLLSAKYSSISIQQIYAKELGFSVNKGSEKKPIYEIVDQGLGFISITYVANSEDEAKKFIEITKNVYKEKIIPDWNQNRSSSYIINPNTDFISSVSLIKTSTLNYSIPVLIAVITSLVIIALLPLKQSELN
jgi:hypothetical protein